MTDLSANVIPLHQARQGDAIHSSAWATLRSLGATVARLPHCGTPMAEIRGECMRFRLPDYCAMCERNPANR